MRLTPFTIIDQLPDSTVLEGIEAKITAIYERKTGNNAHGDWSMQNITLAQGQHTVRGVLKDRELLPQNWKNKTVLICSNENAKGKLSGVRVEDNEYNGQVTRRLNITPSATFEEVGAGEQRQAPARQQQEEAPPARQQAAPAQNRPQTAQTRQPAQGYPEALNGIKKTVARINNLWGVCYDAATAQAHSVLNRHGYAMTPQAVGILADKLLMESIRRVDLDSVPLTMPEFKGRPLADLIPFLQESVDASIVHRTKLEEAARSEARQHPAPAATRPAPQTPAPAREEPTEDGWHDDEIPF